MGGRMNWTIPKIGGSRERSNQGSAVEEVAALSQVRQAVSPRSHHHLSSQAFPLVDSWGSFFASLFWGHLTSVLIPQCLPPLSHFSLRQRWFYFLLLWVTASGCDDRWKRCVTISSLIYFFHNGPSWKVSIGTGIMPFHWVSSPPNDQGSREKSGVRLVGFHSNHCLPQSCTHTSFCPRRRVLIYCWLNLEVPEQLRRYCLCLHC